MNTKFQTIVLFASAVDTPNSTGTAIAVHHPQRGKGAVGAIRIRAVATHAELSDALFKARPRKGEIILNAIPVPS